MDTEIENKLLMSNFPGGYLKKNSLMKFFDPKKHIWSGIFGSFKDCEKSKKCNNFFDAKNWLQGQDELVKEIALKKRKTNLLIKFLKN